MGNIELGMRRGRKPADLPFDVSRMPVNDFMRVLPTPTQKDTVLKLTLLGGFSTLEELGREEGVTRQAIHSRKTRAVRRLEEYSRGEPLLQRNRSREKGAYLRRLSPEELGDLRNPNLTHTAISRNYGVPFSTVQRWRKDLGVEVKKGRPKK